MTEFLPLIVVHVDYICRPKELPKLQAVQFERPPHLYIIASRPRITAKPESITIGDQFIEGTVCIQRGGEFTEHRFYSRHQLGANLTFEAPWPHDEYRVIEDNGEVVASGVVANLGSVATHEWPAETHDFDVLYVGQTYGTDGKRIAPDRLASHATLQKILSDCPPDRQIWLMVASISDEQLLIEMDPRAEASTSVQEDKEHIKRVTDTINSPVYDESDAVSLAEAGLIRYFQPEYNQVFKNLFPAPRLKMLETLRPLDLLALVIELQSDAVLARFGSGNVPYSFYHEAKFYIHLDGENRRSDWAMRDWLKPDA